MYYNKSHEILMRERVTVRTICGILRYFLLHKHKLRGWF